MRNIFDQYTQPENRITHALVMALTEDTKLLRAFVHWTTGQTCPSGPLYMVEQRLPGEPEIHEADAERRGIPDAWIFNDDSWCMLIESKIEATLNNDQLRRHHQTAIKRDFAHIVVVVLDAKPLSKNLPPDIVFRRWHEVYTWLNDKRRESEWAKRVAQYLEIAENRFREDGYMQEGNLTTFSGIPFSSDEPYNYLESKRILRLAMGELRKNKALVRELGMDPSLGGRPSITGKDGDYVWDFLRLKEAGGDGNFTLFPHLTLSIQNDALLVIVTVPHGIKSKFRNNLVSLGFDSFSELIRNVNTRLLAALHKASGAAPWCVVVQRRYPTQRSAAIIDGRLEFDLRTAFPQEVEDGNSVKVQSQWLQATYDVLRHKRSNLQVAVGAIFPYRACSATANPEIIKTIANVWIACKPLLDAMLKGHS